MTIVVFSKVEEHTKNTVEDMDYQVQILISRVNEEVGTMLENVMSQNKENFEKHNEASQNLMMAFQEQADSISLYAKEINLDVNELKDGLKESVKVFKDDTNDSVRTTLDTFDEGLAELADRLALTTESIREAVENLPKAIKQER